MSEAEPEDVGGGPCRSCGIVLPAGARFCGNCGVADPGGPLVAAEVAPPAEPPAMADDELTVPRARNTARPPVADARPTKAESRPPPVRLTPRSASGKQPGHAPVSSKARLPTPLLSRGLGRPSVAGEPPSSSASSWPDVEDELEEIRYLLEQGLDDDARDALARLRAAHPDHPELARVHEEPAGTLRVDPTTATAISTASVGPNVDTATAASPPVDTVDAAVQSDPAAVEVSVDTDDEDISAAVDAIMADDSEPPLTPDGTVISYHPSPPAPFEEAPPLETAGGLLDERRTERRPGRVTVIPEDPSRPSPPAPFDGDPTHDVRDDAPPRGQTLIPTTVSEAASAVKAPSEDSVEADPPAPETTEEGTVIAANPLPPAPYQESEAPEASVSSLRLAMLGATGDTVDERQLAAGESLEIGHGGETPWGDDPELEPRHARLFPVAEGLAVEAFDPVNGVFRRIDTRTPMRDGDAFRVGESLLTFERHADDADAGSHGRLVVTARDGQTRAYPVDAGGLSIGRDDADVTFEDDTYVSGEHCRITCDGAELFIEDLHSSNGTYVRLRPGDIVAPGGVLLMGHTQFEITRP